MSYTCAFSRTSFFFAVILFTCSSCKSWYAVQSPATQLAPGDIVRISFHGGETIRRMKVTATDGDHIVGTLTASSHGRAVQQQQSVLINDAALIRRREFDPYKTDQLVNGILQVAFFWTNAIVPSNSGGKGHARTAGHGAGDTRSLPRAHRMK